MLFKLTRKFCPLMSLALLSVGCGKKIVDAETQQGSQGTENQERSSTYVLSINENETSKRYLLPDDANFKVPDRLHITSGNAVGKQVDIAYQVDAYDEEDFQFKCSYTEAPDDVHVLLLKSCYDYDLNDFGDVSQHTFSLYKNDAIDISLKGQTATSFEVLAIHSMNWIVPR